LLLITLLVVLGPAFAQEGGQKTPEPVEKTAKEKAAAPEKNASKPELPFQIQLLETHIRFENNGDSRKEVHTVVKINNVLGAHQFARLTFDYNRAFQQVEIPLVRISHANGGTSELLPSAVVDAPNPAVEKFPAYQDVRVKSVRILGLQEGDTIEYRVITTTTKHPLAPDFWLEHTFDRSGQVLEEDYELDLPGNLTSTSSERAAVWNGPKPAVFVGVPTTSFERSRSGSSERSKFGWKISSERTLPRTGGDDDMLTPDVIVSSFWSWNELARKIGAVFPKWADADGAEAEQRLHALKVPLNTPEEKLRASYELISQKLTTVNLPIASMGFRIRPAKEIFDSGYASPDEKCYLLWRLASPAESRAEIVFYGGAKANEDYPRPSVFQQVFVIVRGAKKDIALDPSAEVAPFGVIPARFRGKRVLSLSPRDAGDYVYYWVALPEDLPFHSRQRVKVAAELGSEGNLTAKVGYELRGDNELLLRVAFHQTAKEKWKDVAGLLAISDGFRGQVTSVNVSDPLATKDPFTVEYEISQPKFVDWSKKPVRIPALLPQIGLPDPPAKQAGGEAAHAIELGTPLDVDTQMSLKLPRGTVVQAPAGTSVERDYARFFSKYSTAANTVTASRRVNFLLREISGERAMDYSAFVRAVQSDQAQSITLVPAVAAADAAKPAKATTKQ
jgi:hypothetical protein